MLLGKAKDGKAVLAGFTCSVGALLAKFLKLSMTFVDFGYKR